LNYKYRDVNTL